MLDTMNLLELSGLSNITCHIIYETMMRHVVRQWCSHCTI